METPHTVQYQSLFVTTELPPRHRSTIVQQHHMSGWHGFKSSVNSWTKNKIMHLIIMQKVKNVRI